MYQTQFALDEFLEKVESSPQSVLMLDYDGTLSPLVEERDRAVPYPEVPELLSEIMQSGRTRVVIVSGRKAEDVGRLLALDTLPEIWGSHGLERRLPDGSMKTGRVDRRSARAINDAISWAVKEGLESNLERKPGGIALHWRGLDADTVEDLYQKAKLALLPLTRSTRLSLAEFDGGIELRVRNCHKGHVVGEILGETGDVPSAYLGDDRTDEDAFRALQGRGLTVLVRQELRPTAAELWITPPDELNQFLGNWITATRRSA